VQHVRTVPEPGTLGVRTHCCRLTYCQPTPAINNYTCPPCPGGVLPKFAYFSN